jgi:four helix bundle protein
MKKTVKMMRLRIYDVALWIVKVIARLLPRVQRRDPDLARQMRRASASVVLNLSEGVHSRGRNQAARFQDAMASARETVSCLEVCIALGYLEAAGLEKVLDQLDRVVATTWKLIHRR